MAIATGEVLYGDLPPRATRPFREWARLHRDELEENWKLAQGLRPLNAIEPLP